MPINRRHMYAAIALFSLGNVLLWGTLGMAYVSTKAAPQTTLYGVPLDGLSRHEAVAHVQPVFDKILDQKVELAVASAHREATLAELGYQIETARMIETTLTQAAQRSWWNTALLKLGLVKPRDPALVYTINDQKLDAFFTELEDEVATTPTDISFTYEDKTLKLQPATAGISLVKEQVTDTIKTSLKPASNITQLTLPYTTIAPAMAEESQAATLKPYLEKLLAQPLVVEVDGTKTEISPDEIYDFIIFGSQNNTLMVTFDETKIKTKAEAIAKKVNKNPTTKRVSGADSSTIVEGADGKKLNLDDATNKIVEKLKSGETTPLVLGTEKVERKVVTETPEYQLGRFDGKYIEVDLSSQKMTLIEGQNKVASYRVSTGKWSTPTPIGEFEIHNHISTAWSARYKLYMDDWMAITADGEYGIHRLPRWPNGALEGASHIGTPVSHGCIRLAPGDSGAVYAWAANGTKVIIHQ